MRVLLYETGKSGHRGVYRHYYEAALRSAGVDVVVHSGPPFEGLFGFNVHLQRLAKDEACDLVHVLTMDDHTKRLFCSRTVSQSDRAAPVVATYYLYSNILHPIKGRLLRMLIADQKLTALIVPSAMQLLAADAARRYRGVVYALPEPAEIEPISTLTKSEALVKMGLPEDWSDKAVVLVFGVLNRRRGVDEITRLISSISAELNESRFIFAGPLDRATLSAQTLKRLEFLSEHGLARVLDQWWSSDESRPLFACADIFCTIPDKKFQGASSTVAKALGCGLLVLAPIDSVAGQCAKLKGQGVLFRRGDSKDFARCLHAAAKLPRENIATRTEDKEDYPLSTGLSNFGQRLMRVYEEVVAGRA
jgi:hypothetical protein